jgi:hypothetical protein
MHRSSGVRLTSTDGKRAYRGTVCPNSPYVDTCPYCSVPAARIGIEAEHAISCGHDPATNGHMPVVPRKHVGTVYELTSLEQKAEWALVAEAPGRLLTGPPASRRMASTPPCSGSHAKGDGLAGGGLLDQGRDPLNKQLGRDSSSRPGPALAGGCDPRL